jgi:hypothetical protein
MIAGVQGAAVSSPPPLGRSGDRPSLFVGANSAAIQLQSN